MDIKCLDLPHFYKDTGLPKSSPMRKRKAIKKSMNKSIFDHKPQ